MNRWTGPTRGGTVDPEIIERLDSRLRNCLSGTSLTFPEIEQIAHEIIQAVQYAFVGRDNRLRSNKPGRPKHFLFIAVRQGRSDAIAFRIDQIGYAISPTALLARAFDREVG